MTDSVETRMKDERAFNAQLIQEFRQNQGKVGGQFEGANLLLVQTTGAKTGRHRLTPLAYLAQDDRYYIFAAGPYRPRHPDWYFNLVAHPEVTIEVGAETVSATARVLAGDDRERIYRLFVAEIPQLPEWQRDAGREFPIVELTRTSNEEQAA